MGKTIRSPFGGAELQTPVYGAAIAATITNSETVITPGTLTGNPTINLTIDSEVQGGAEIALILTDDGAARVVTFGTGFHTGTPAHTMGAGLTTALVFQHDGTDFIQVDSAGTAINIAAAQAAIAAIANGTTSVTGRVKNTNAGTKGTAGAGVTAVHYGDGTHFTTVLTLTAVAVGSVTNANKAIGALIYSFPAGIHVHEVSRFSVGLSSSFGADASTPVVALGSTIGVGAVAVLHATLATMDDYTGESAVADCNATAKVIGPVGAVAGLLTGISLNAVASVKTLHFNAAGAWAHISNITADGTVVLKWSVL